MSNTAARVTSGHSRYMSRDPRGFHQLNLRAPSLPRFWKDPPLHAPHILPTLALHHLPATPLFGTVSARPAPSCLLSHCQALVLPTFIHEAHPDHTSHTGSLPAPSSLPHPQPWLPSTDVAATFVLGSHLLLQAHWAMASWFPLGTCPVLSHSLLTHSVVSALPPCKSVACLTLSPGQL